MGRVKQPEQATPSGLALNGHLAFRFIIGDAGGGEGGGGDGFGGPHCTLAAL